MGEKEGVEERGGEREEEETLLWMLCLECEWCEEERVERRRDVHV